MNRIAFALAVGLMLLAGFMWSASAQPTLSLDPVDVEQGRTATLKLRISGGIEPYAGVNARIILPDGISFLSASPGGILPGSFFVDSQGFANGGNEAAVIAYSDIDTLSANNGVLLNLRVRAANDATLGLQTAFFAADMSAISNEDGSESVVHMVMDSTINIVEQGQGGGEGEGEGPLGGEGEGEGEGPVGGEGEGEPGGGGGLEGEGEIEAEEGEAMNSDPPAVDVTIGEVIADVDLPIGILVRAIDLDSDIDRVEVAVNDMALPGVIDNQNGTWSAVFTPNNSGVFDLEAIAFDDADNSNIASLTFRVLEDGGEGEGEGEGVGVDTVPPAIDVELGSLLIETGHSITVTVRAADGESEIDRVEVRIDGENLTLNDNGGGIWSGDFVPSEAGLFNAVATAYDADDNSSSSRASFIAVGGAIGPGEGEGEQPTVPVSCPTSALASDTPFNDLLNSFRTLRDSRLIRSSIGTQTTRAYYFTGSRD